MTDAETVMKTNCIGTLCDRCDPEDVNCSCYLNKDCNAGKCPVFSADITVTDSNLTINDWSSYHFTQLLFKGDISSGVVLDNYQVQLLYYNEIKALVQYVNEIGGWL